MSLQTDLDNALGKSIDDICPNNFHFRKANEYYGPKFNHADYTATLDHWAYLLYASGYCESKNFFNVFNTYDRAKFTYGFYQLAAHTPNDNLILLFRRLVNLDLAKQYFPELTLINGRLHRVNEAAGKLGQKRYDAANNEFI